VKETKIRHLSRTAVSIAASAVLLTCFASPAHSMFQRHEHPDGRTKMDTPATLRKEEGLQKVYAPHPSHKAAGHATSARDFTPPSGDPQAVLAVTRGMSHLPGGVALPKSDESGPSRAVMIGITVALCAGIFAAARWYMRKLDGEWKSMESTRSSHH
jgi:hypothetical protein